MKSQNQQNPPSPKRRCVDSQGNVRVKFSAKDGGTTMPLVSGLTPNGCKILETKIKEAVSSLGGKLIVNFVNFR